MKRSEKSGTIFSNHMFRYNILLLSFLICLTGCTAVQGVQSVETTGSEPQTVETQGSEAPAEEIEEAETADSETSDAEAPADESLSAEELYQIGKEAYGEEDYEKAYEYFSRSAELGDPSGLNALGVMYQYGSYVEQSNEKAIEYYEAAAKQDDVDALYNLGLIYDADGDHEKSFEYIKKAADMGDSLSQLRLGYLYEQGLGVKQDYVMAADSYKNCAEQGLNMGFHNLGILSLDGHGLKQSYENGVMYLTRAALMDHNESFEALGEMYRDGEGVKKDDKMAADFFNKAAGMGNENAKKSYEALVSENRIPEDYKPSEPLLELDPDKLCEQGIEALGNKDYETAYACFLCAAADNSAKAEYNLGIMYSDGTGVEQSDEKAKEFFTSAADKGNEDARKALGK